MKTKYLLAAAAMTASINANAAFITAIDLFKVGQAVSDSTSTNGTSSDGGVFNAVLDPLYGSAGQSIIGGERDIYVDVLKDTGWGGGVDGNPLDAATVTVNTVTNVLSFDTPTEITASATIQWDGQDNNAALNTTGLGGIDLFALGANAFQFETVQTDLGAFLTIEVYTSATQWTKALIKTTGPAIETILFSDLMNAAFCGASTGNSVGLISVTCGGGGTANLASLGAIQTILNVDGGTTSLDMKIGKIVTVPEPSVIGLFGIGLMAAGFASTRRRTGTLQA